MKSVTEALSAYLNTQKEMVSCDLYTLTLFSGAAYYFTDADHDVAYEGHTYLHNAIMLKREQTKLNNVVSVDSMTVSIYATVEDKHSTGRRLP